MQNELYVENNVLNLKDYIGLQDEKNVSKVIYWEWKEETGYTEEEIRQNDLKDSEFMGKRLEMAISVTGRQDVATSSNYYMVTLDANGGKIGSSASVQKQVVGGKEYGELPIPTREGYTFMGWNGKNLVNMDKAVNESLIDNGDGTYTMWYNEAGRFGNILYDKIFKGETITMSYDLLEYNSTYRAKLQIVLYNAGEPTYVNDYNPTIQLSRDIISFRIYQQGDQPVGTYTKFKNLQLEKGSTATAYEPYYLTPSTKVTQNKNHTLTAIWKKN